MRLGRLADAELIFRRQSSCRSSRWSTARRPRRAASAPQRARCVPRPCALTHCREASPIASCCGLCSPLRLPSTLFAGCLCMLAGGERRAARASGGRRASRAPSAAGVESGARAAEDFFFDARVGAALAPCAVRGVPAARRSVGRTRSRDCDVIYIDNHGPADCARTAGRRGDPPIHDGNRRDHATHGRAAAGRGRGRGAARPARRRPREKINDTDFFLTDKVRVDVDTTSQARTAAWPFCVALCTEEESRHSRTLSLKSHVS